MVKPMARVTEKQEALSQILKVIEKFRDLDPEIQTQTVAVFLVVAKNPKPIKMQDIANELGLAQSSVSRNVAWLGSWSRHRKKGQELLEAYEDPMERRRKLVRLTAKGSRFAKSLSALI
jgi:DNA-binding MarR family transcriptional regulator